MKEQRLEVGADVLNGATLTTRAVVRHFTSLTSATETTKAKPANSSNLSRWTQTNGGDRSSPMEWYGVEKGLPQVREILSRGWHEGRERLDKVADQLGATQNIAKPVSVRRRRIRSDQGDTLDMNRVWAGDISQAWERCSRITASTTRYIEIIASPAINAGTDASVTFWRGAAALVLADAASAAGYAVAITAAIPTRRTLQSGEDCLDLVTMKGYSDPLDMDNLASLICLAGWFRYVWFQMAAHHGDPINESFGRAQSVESFLKLAPHQVCGLDAVHDMSTARDWVTKSLAALGQEQLAA
jgi:hypothetical protein